MNAEELAQAVGRAKALIDNGLCRVGPRLDRGDAQAAVLTGAASRALALSDAAVRLCSGDHAAEALPLLRQLCETAVELRWTAGDAARAVGALAALESPRWQTLWDDAILRSRAGEAGVPEGDVSAVLGLAADFTGSNRAGAPWSHIFPASGRRAPEAARVLALTARFMGHALAGLEARWPGNFPGAEELCSS
ncbi:MAG: hypothetical protein HYV15_04395 [Elusimicrobia bacterium]|nr:hypothetical protein [Elusimicrobiota bacterium]